MYISVFGASNYVNGVAGSIILRDRTIHDIERGTEEFGGYGSGASSVSYRGLRIAKPLLIPREIHTFLSPQGQHTFAAVPRVKGSWDHEVIATQFQENARRIFGKQLVFAYIFDSFAIEKDQKYSGVDTLICVREVEAKAVEEYVNWLLGIHEVFGRIPDFKHPCEIVPFAAFQAAVEKLPQLELSIETSGTMSHDAILWCSSLSQPSTGVVYPENIPGPWKEVFPQNSSRLLRSLLGDLERVIMAGSDIVWLGPAIHGLPRKEPELSSFTSNLSSRGLVSLLKMVPFKAKPIYTEIVLRVVAKREFIGRSVFTVTGPEDLYHPCFRFGAVAPVTANHA
jgi:hypothetical protein